MGGRAGLVEKVCCHAVQRSSFSSAETVTAGQRGPGRSQSGDQLGATCPFYSREGGGNRHSPEGLQADRAKPSAWVSGQLSLASPSSPEGQGMYLSVSEKPEV